MPCERKRRSRVASSSGVRGDRAALAGRDRLHRVEREHAGVGVRAVADRAVGCERAERVRGVLDDARAGGGRARTGRSAARRSAPRPARRSAPRWPRSRFSVLGSMSTKVGLRADPQRAARARHERQRGGGDAVALADSGRPQRRRAARRCRSRTRRRARRRSIAQSAASNRSTAGPCVSQSPRSTSTTAAMSSSSIDCRP